MTELRALTAAPRKLTVVDAFATWCGPCKAIAPQFHELAMSRPHVQFAKFDVDAAQDIAAELQISAMPTFVFFRDGKEVHRVRGADMRSIVAAVDQYGVKAAPTIPDDATLQTMKPKELLTLMAELSISSLGMTEKTELIAELGKHRK